jgi:hypothetical protein
MVNLSLYKMPPSPVTETQIYVMFCVKSNVFGLCMGQIDPKMPCPHCPECGRRQRTRQQIKAMRRRCGDGPLLCDRCRQRPPPLVPPPLPKIEEKQQKPSTIVLTKANIPSSKASDRTKRRRSALLYDVLKYVSTTQNRDEEEQEEDMAVQLGHFLDTDKMKRIIIMASRYTKRYIGQLSVKDGIILKASGMTWSHMRYFRSFFNGIVGWTHVLPAEYLIRNELKKYEIKYESGYVDCPHIDQPKVPYIHIQVEEIWKVIKLWAHRRYNAGQLLWWPNQDDDELSFVIGIDKGGRYTKLLLTWLNHDQPQSDDASLLLGVYQGPEDHALISLVFRELLQKLGNIPSNWSIKLSTNNIKSVNKYSRIMVSKSFDQWNNSKPTEPIWLNKMVINKCRFYYGGDMPSIGTLIGLSGPSGTYFCNNCLIKKVDLKPKPGVLHALQAPVNGLGIIDVPMLRSLEHMQESHELYVIKDKKKRKVADDYNCVRPCLVHTEISNHLVPTITFKYGDCTAIIR